jgi:hypothetical protein
MSWYQLYKILYTKPSFSVNLKEIIGDIYKIYEPVKISPIHKDMSLQTCRNYLILFLAQADYMIWNRDIEYVKRKFDRIKQLKNNETIISQETDDYLEMETNGIKSGKMEVGMTQFYNGRYIISVTKLHIHTKIRGMTLISLSLVIYDIEDDYRFELSLNRVHDQYRHIVYCPGYSCILSLNSWNTEIKCPETMSEIINMAKSKQLIDTLF